MAKVSIKYAGDNFGHTIDICELGNSLLGFGEFFQTIAKENNLTNLNVSDFFIKKIRFFCFFSIIIKEWLKYATKNFNFIHRNAKKSKKTIQKGWNPF